MFLTETVNSSLLFSRSFSRCAYVTTYVIYNAPVLTLPLYLLEHLLAVDYGRVPLREVHIYRASRLASASVGNDRKVGHAALAHGSEKVRRLPSKTVCAEIWLRTSPDVMCPNLNRQGSSMPRRAM